MATSSRRAKHDASDEDQLRQRVGDADAVRRAFEEMPIMQLALEGPEHVVIAASAG